MSNRRRYERRICTELVNISTATRKDRAGLARDVSATGVRFQSGSRFAVGESVEILFQSASIGTKHAAGRVVWTGDTPDYSSVFPHTAVVEFEVPWLDLGRDSAQALAVSRLI